MKVQIQSIHFKATEELQVHIQEKLDKLDQFHPGLLHAEVFLRLESGEAKDNKTVEVELFLPGPSIFAETRSHHFESALTEVVAQLKRQILKRKAKLQEQR